MNANTSPQPGEAKTSGDQELAMKLGLRPEPPHAPGPAKRDKEEGKHEFDEKYTLSLLLASLRR